VSGLFFFTLVTSATPQGLSKLRELDYVPNPHENKV
jgi:hypothetical protein